MSEQDHIAKTSSFHHEMHFHPFCNTSTRTQTRTSTHSPSQRLKLGALRRCLLLQRRQLAGGGVQPLLRVCGPSGRALQSCMELSCKCEQGWEGKLKSELGEESAVATAVRGKRRSKGAAALPEAQLHSDWREAM